LKTHHLATLAGNSGTAHNDKSDLVFLCFAKKMAGKESPERECIVFRGKTG
jgi:hypothetical protein